MRLIDSDSFLGFMIVLEEAGAEHISFDDLKKFISEQRTAYDLEKVIKQLKKRIEDYKNLNSEEEIVDVAIKETERIIEIVKSGGVGNGD